MAKLDETTRFMALKSPDFLTHLEDVYENLSSGGVKGLMFDYPGYAWSYGGGMEDKYSTTAAAYRNIFRMPHDGMGPESYVHERNMEREDSVGSLTGFRFSLFITAAVLLTRG